MLLFNFQDFISEMREKADKKEIVEKYEQLYGPIQGDIYDQVRYTDYLSKFSYVEYATSEELSDDFDRDLLQKLVLWSFSSDYELKFDQEKHEYELYIAVKNWDQSVVKTLSELWSFQVLRLYEIYIEEQLNLHILKAEDEDQWAIDAQREVRLKKWGAILDTMDRVQLAEEVKASQEEMLWDLMGQL